MSKCLTRQQLYALVWDRPMAKLAKEFGLSELGFGITASEHRGLSHCPSGFLPDCIRAANPSLIYRANRGAATMEVSYVPANEALIVAPVGRVDEATWEVFGAHLSRGIDQASSEALGTLIIDLSRIDYMSSRGLRALTVAKQEGIAAGVSIRLANPNDVMREILAISRYNRLFAIDDPLRADDGTSG